MWVLWYELKFPNLAPGSIEKRREMESYEKVVEACGELIAEVNKRRKVPTMEDLAAFAKFLDEAEGRQGGDEGEADGN